MNTGKRTDSRRISRVGLFREAHVSTQIALIRGINVGRANRVAMADLRSGVEALGFTNVRTLLNSGNLIYTAGRTPPHKSGKQIEELLQREFNIHARVIVLAEEEVDEIIRSHPLHSIATDPSRLMIAVPAVPADLDDLKSITRESWSPDVIAIDKRVAWIWCANGVLASRLVEAVSHTLRDRVTTRNWATMQKLHALMRESSGPSNRQKT